MPHRRLFANIFLILSVLYFPWWVTTAFVVVCLFLFTGMYEVVFYGLLIDVLYGAHNSVGEGFVWVFTLSYLVALVFISYIRKSILM